MRAKEYIRYLLSIECFSFSYEDISNRTGAAGTALKFELARLVEKKEIVNLRKGFYLIIPPRYSKSGHLPIQLYVENLFGSLNRNYYLGFYTAAKFHGASHQQVHRDYVMTEKPKMSDIDKGVYDIRFFTSTNWPRENISVKTSDAGTFKISSPALTAIDLIHHQTKLGGLSRILTILEDLCEEITNDDMSALLSWYSHKSTIQRFGYIMDLLDAPLDLDIVMKHLAPNRFFPVLLSSNGSRKPGSVDNKWKVDVNVILESDL